VSAVSAEHRARFVAAAEKEVAAAIIPAYQHVRALLAAQLPGGTDDDGAWRLPRGGDFYPNSLESITTTKRHHPKAIATPPFHAIQYFPLSRKSMGGMVVELSCRVPDLRGQEIPNLYAVGELTGVGGINGQCHQELDFDAD